MRIGIDCRTILQPEGGERAGLGHYTSALVEQLLEIGSKHEFVLFFDSRAGDVSGFETEHSKVVMLPFSSYKRFMPFAYSHMLVSAAMRRERLDILHGPANTTPLSYKKTTVVTVHDLAIYKHPEWFPDGQGFSVKVTVPKSVARAKKIIAVSKSTKEDLKEVFDIPGSAVRVVHEGVEPTVDYSEKRIRGLLDEMRIGKPYVFFVGTVEPRKNLKALIKGFDAMMEKRHKFSPRMSLVIAGGKGWKYEPVFEAMKKARFAHNIRYVGYVSAEQKHALMQGASCFAFPSLYEGFGLPVLEAMQAGTPVLTSNVSSLPEVAGDAAEYVSPEDVDSIAKGLDRVLFGRGVSKKLVANGYEQVKKFSWRQTARKTLDVYEAAAE